jgi:hypothetical protein
MDDIFVELCDGDFELADDGVAVRTGKRDLDSDKIRIGMLIHGVNAETRMPTVVRSMRLLKNQKKQSGKLGLSQRI